MGCHDDRGNTFDAAGSRQPHDGCEHAVARYLRDQFIGLRRGSRMPGEE
jgi:hypothetical protein